MTFGRVTRQSLISGAAAIASAKMTEAAPPDRWDVAVVGAGVFGAWTAVRLRASGKRVLLIDAFGPAHARASSVGESRMTRTDYGAHDIYTQMAWASLPEWKALSAVAGLPVFHPTCVGSPRCVAIGAAFPALAGTPLVESRVCQYENSANGDFLAEHHRQWRNVVLVGGGFRPRVRTWARSRALRRRACAGTLTTPEQRFSLASKGLTKARAVH